jgi:methanethiol S-methyltransferase
MALSTEPRGGTLNHRAKILDYTMIVLAALWGIGSVVLLALGGSSGYTHFGWSERDILVWDIFLSLLFFVQHSGMVRRSFRQKLAFVYPSRYQGAIYSIASGVALTIVVVFWQRSSISLLILEGIPRLIAMACSLMAILIFGFSAYSLRSFDLLGLRPIRAHLRDADYQPAPFVVRGPYRWVRHPLYSCVLVLLWSNPDLTLDRLLFTVLWTGWICIGAHLEERDLTREFGATYREYQKAVPMLIPWRGPLKGMHESES